MSAATSTFPAVTDATWTEEVLLREGPVLVDFWAGWCGPCRKMWPLLEQLSADWGDRVRVVSLDIDANPNTTRDYGVLSAPTLMLFRGGEPVRSVVGVAPKARLAAQLELAL